MRPSPTLALRALLLLVLLAPGACGGGEGKGDGDTPPTPDTRDLADATDSAPDLPAGDARPEAGPGDAGEVAPEVAEPFADAANPDAGDADVGDAGTGDALPEEITPPPPGVRFDPASEGFYGWPFPSLLRVTASGAPDYARLPNPKNVAVIKKYVETVPKLVDGAGCNGPVYFGLTRPLDPATLPDPAGALLPDSSVRLVDVDPDSPERGRAFPVRVQVVDQPIEGYFEPPVLTILPIFGFPLRPGTLYAALLTEGLRTSGGEALEAPALLTDALAGAASAEVQAALDPLVAALPDLGIAAADVVGATVFRTGHPTAQLQALRRYIVDTGLVPTVTEVHQTKDRPDCIIFEGKLDSWNFQQGSPPYQSGGAFAYDDQGVPLAKPETLDFALSVPKQPAPTASGGMPLVLYSHGTGGSYKTFTTNGVADEMGEAGVAGLGVDQPLHGARWSGSDNDYLLELYSFNFTNPPAGVTTFRQAALDLVLLSQLALVAGQIDLSATEYGQVARFDPDALMAFGHSQGGLVVPPYLGIEPRNRGGVVSAGGGVLIETILYRETLDTANVSIRAVVAGMLQLDDPLDLTEVHPVMAVVQNASDLIDPINYARLVNVPGNRKHILQVQGGQDPYTPLSTAHNLAVAWRLPTLDYPGVTAPSEHAGVALTGLAHLPLPLSGTVPVSGAAPATGALMIFPNADHFPVFHQNLAKALYRELFAAIPLTDPPVITGQ